MSPLAGQASAQTVTLSSSVEQDGRQAACPGEVVTFTCMVTNETRLRWIAEPFINLNEPIQYPPRAIVGEMMVDMSGQFMANVTSVTLNGGVADLTSELTVTVSAPEALNGTVVQCSGQLSTMMNKTLIIAGTYAIAMHWAVQIVTSLIHFYSPQPLPLLHSSQAILFHCIT